MACSVTALLPLLSLLSHRVCLCLALEELEYVGVGWWAAAIFMCRARHVQAPATAPGSLAPVVLTATSLCWHCCRLLSYYWSLCSTVDTAAERMLAAVLCCVVQCVQTACGLTGPCSIDMQAWSCGVLASAGKVVGVACVLDSPAAVIGLQCSAVPSELPLDLGAVVWCGCTRRL